MRAILLSSLWLLVACGGALPVVPLFGGDGVVDRPGGQTDADAGTGDSTNGAPQSSTGGGSGAIDSGTPGGSASDGGTSNDCALTLQGTGCALGASCAWFGGCNTGSCSCVSGKWSCRLQTTCAPPEQDAGPSVTLVGRCGESCSASGASGECQCGSSTTHASCSCTGGTWSCVGQLCH